MQETVGAVAYKATHDTTRYDPLEIGHAVNEDIGSQIQECIRIYSPKIDEDEFCVCFVWADDPLIAGVRRRKFYGWPYLPSPRPDQGVFLYNKRKDSLEKRLWILPQAQVMEALYTSSFVPDELKLMQSWCRGFYEGYFWQLIREQQNITLLSQLEYSNAHREELIKSGSNEFTASEPYAFDFSKIAVNKVINSKDTLTDQ